MKIKKLRHIFFTTGIILCASFCFAQQYFTNQGQISFFSETPLKNISAVSKKALAVIDTKTKEIALLISNNSFEFENKLMEEHYNEKYIESEKYPNSSFKGKILSDINFQKEGTYNVEVEGILNIHGVDQKRKINGTISVNADNTISIISTYKVKLEDHKVEVPKLVFKEIAQEIEIKVNIVAKPKK